MSRSDWLCEMDNMILFYIDRKKTSLFCCLSRFRCCQRRIWKKHTKIRIRAIFCIHVTKTNTNTYCQICQHRASCSNTRKSYISTRLRSIYPLLLIVFVRLYENDIRRRTNKHAFGGSVTLHVAAYKERFLPHGKLSELFVVLREPRVNLSNIKFSIYRWRWGSFLVSSNSSENKIKKSSIVHSVCLHHHFQYENWRCYCGSYSKIHKNTYTCIEHPFMSVRLLRYIYRVLKHTYVQHQHFIVHSVEGKIKNKCKITA